MSKNIYQLIIVVFISVLSGCDIAGGSYPYVERYEIQQSENALISEVEDFLKENPQFVVPRQTLLENGRNDKTDHWYHIYFYYPEENQVVYTWVRPSGKKKTTFALVGINEGLELGNWEFINENFDSHQNKEVKTKFENRILKNIKDRFLPEYDGLVIHQTDCVSSNSLN